MQISTEADWNVRGKNSFRQVPVKHHNVEQTILNISESAESDTGSTMTIIVSALSFKCTFLSCWQPGNVSNSLYIL